MAIDFPSNPTDGQLYTNPTTGIVYAYSNTTLNWSSSANSTVGYTGSTGSIGYTGSSGIQIKTLEYTGTLNLTNGTKKWWFSKASTVSRIVGFIDTPPTGSSATIRVNKNASNVGLFSISAGSSTFSSNVSISLAQGDYITVDITQVGSTVAGSDLSLIFEYV